MLRIDITPRDDWQQTAERTGFAFHTIDGEPYWDETACYRFSLEQIENHIEDPTQELEQMCFEVVDRVVRDESLLRRLCIPENRWDLVAGSWQNRERNLYGRMDFSYNGEDPAKLLEYNADTPTSLYESAVFQWLWLEQAMERELIPPGCDQYNSLHESLIEAFKNFGIQGPLHLTCCRDSAEDAGTVSYVQECAEQAGLDCTFLYMEDIGASEDGKFTDEHDRQITTLFKLYPWEWMLQEDFADLVPDSGCTMIEPAWKAVLSNKGLLPLLWQMFEGHPNLLPSFFADDPKASSLTKGYAKKPLFSREGANVELHPAGAAPLVTDGPYGAEGQIVQALCPLPEFSGNHTVVGSWLVASQPCGMGIREDRSPITKDSSRFLPHVIY